MSSNTEHSFPILPPMLSDIDYERINRDILSDYYVKQCGPSTNPSFVRLAVIEVLQRVANPPLVSYAFELFKRNSVLQYMLVEAWKKGDFSEILRLEILQTPQTLERIKNPVASLRGPSIAQQFRETTYVSSPLQAFKNYMKYCFQRFLRGPQYGKAYHGLYLSIVQSSGTGKSRLISELGKANVFVVHMTLRDITDKGFPIWDDTPVRLLSAKNVEDSKDYEARCSAFFVSLFTALESTIQEICTTKCERHNRTFSKCVEAWQNEFGSFAPRREEFFAIMQKTFDDVYNTMFISTRLANRKSVVPGPGGNPAEVAELSFSGKDKMVNAYRSLVNVVKSLLPKGTYGGTDPDVKVILGFDEAAILTHEQGLEDEKYIPAHILCRAISIYSLANRYPIWAIFASTNSRVANFSAPSKIHPSLCVSVGGDLLFRPFTELGFDQSAPKFNLDPASWPALNHINHISAFGRPLWFATNQYAPMSEVIAVAKQKLMMAPRFNREKEAVSLALAFQRFALDIVFGNPEAVEYVEMSLASHMRVCISITDDRSWKQTCYPSEPLLSHAAADVMWQNDEVLPTVLFHLKNKIESGMIDVGKNGELVCRLLLLLAKDHYLSRSPTGIPFIDTPLVEDDHLRYCSAIPVNEWLTRLFGEGAWPTDATQNRRAKRTFDDYEVNFSHWINMTEQIAPFKDDMTADEFTKRLYFRTCAVQCTYQQPLIDQLIIIHKKGMNDFSHVLISDKNDVSQIQRSTPSINLQNNLPWIAVSMDLGVEGTGFSSTFFDSDHTRHPNIPCLRISAASMNRETFPFLRQPLEAAMKSILHRATPSPAGMAVVDALREEIQFGHTSGIQFMRWDVN